MIIEPQFQLFSNNFSVIDISRIQAIAVNDGKQEGNVTIFSIVFLGIGVRLVFGTSVRGKLTRQRNN